MLQYSVSRLNRNFAAEMIGRMQERQLFSSSVPIRNASDDIRVFNEILFVSCYTVSSPLRFPGQKCAISSFSEYILCAKTRFHPRQLPWRNGNVHCRSAVVIVWFRVRILLVSRLNFYNSEWREQAIFLHLPKDTCATVTAIAESPMRASLSLLCLRLI